MLGAACSPLGLLPFPSGLSSLQRVAIVGHAWQTLEGNASEMTCGIKATI